MDYHILKRSESAGFGSQSAFERAVLASKVTSFGYGYMLQAPLKKFSLESDAVSIRINALLDSFAFPPKRVVFRSSSLNPYINHLIANGVYIVEVEKDYLEASFDALRFSLPNRVLLSPSIAERERYLEPGIVLLYPLMSKAPVSSNGTIRIEKLLVDLAVTPIYRALYSGKDLEQAIGLLLDGHAINFRTLFAYASRKRKTKEVYVALEKAANGQIKELLHAIKEKL